MPVAGIASRLISALRMQEKVEVLVSKRLKIPAKLIMGTFCE
jgi:hypothetical protein